MGESLGLGVRIIYVLTIWRPDDRKIFKEKKTVHHKPGRVTWQSFEEIVTSWLRRE